MAQNTIYSNVLSGKEQIIKQMYNAWGVWGEGCSGTHPTPPPNTLSPRHPAHSSRENFQKFLCTWEHVWMYIIGGTVQGAWGLRTPGWILSLPLTTWRGDSPSLRACHQVEVTLATASQAIWSQTRASWVKGISHGGSKIFFFKATVQIWEPWLHEKNKLQCRALQFFKNFICGKIHII